MIDPEKVVEDARSWLGVKFKKGGRDRMGVDCIGLLIRVGEAQGLVIRDTLEYSFNPEPQKFADMVYGQTEPLPSNSLKLGSIVLLKQSIFPMHTGILAKDHHDRWSVINANIKERKVVEQLFDQWKSQVIGFRAYKET